jgi:hypothetical protein
MQKPLCQKNDDQIDDQEEIDTPSDGNQLIQFCKKLTIKNLKVNMNDPISLLVQTCESKLNCRPEITYE